SDTDQELKKIYKFIGVTNLEFKAKRPPNHTSCSVVNPLLQMQLRDYFGDRFDRVIEAVRKEEDIALYEESGEDHQAIEQLRNNMKGGKGNMSGSAREYLQNLFSLDMKVLESFLDFKITDWK
ncbi:sulfotransferase, partial [bacterium]|nr:sulfotransferase [bacterium]